MNALTFAAFRAANAERCLKWHPMGIESWSASDWMTAIVGELGELASLIKMRNRERDHLPGNKFSPTDEQIAKEAADVVTYLDLFCEMHGIDLGEAVVAKFNEISERVGFPDRLSGEQAPMMVAPNPVELLRKAMDDTGLPPEYRGAMLANFCHVWIDAYKELPATQIWQKNLK